MGFAYIVLGVDVGSILNQDTDELRGVATASHTAHMQWPGAAAHHEVGKFLALGLSYALKQCLQLGRLAVHDEVRDGRISPIRLHHTQCTRHGEKSAEMQWRVRALCEPGLFASENLEKSR